jgi:hypothetical protein
VGSPLYNVHHSIGTLASSASHRKHAELYSVSRQEVECFSYFLRMLSVGNSGSHLSCEFGSIVTKISFK